MTPLDRLSDLLNAMAEERIDSAGIDQLESLVLQHPECRWAYAQFMHVHATLPEIVGGASATKPRPRRSPSPTHAAPQWRGLALRIAIAAMIVLAIPASIAWVMTRPSRSTVAAAAPVAVLLDAHQAVWADRALASGDAIGPGWLNLQSGSAVVEFNSGARVTLTGPCEFGLNSPMRALLRSGKLTARVPREAHGFTVGGPGCAVVDLGTRFAMSVDKNRRTEVSVLEGRVRVERDGGESRELVVGQTVAVTNNRIVGPSAAVSTSVYRFDTIPLGSPLIRHDNWSAFTGSQAPVVRNNNPQLPGPFAAVSPSANCRIRRQGDARFSLAIPDRSVFTVEFDLLLGSTGRCSRVGLLDAAGHILFEFGNYAARDSQWIVANKNGYLFKSSDQFPTSPVAYDHLVATIDLAANDGDGSFSLAAAPIGKPPLPIDGLQDINLRLAPTRGSEITGFLINLGGGAIGPITFTTHPLLINPENTTDH